jgi:hypothetical protein
VAEDGLPAAIALKDVAIVLVDAQLERPGTAAQRLGGERKQLPHDGEVGRWQARPLARRRVRQPGVLDDRQVEAEGRERAGREQRALATTSQVWLPSPRRGWPRS